MFPKNYYYEGNNGKNSLEIKTIVVMLLRVFQLFLILKERVTIAVENYLAVFDETKDE